MNIDHLELTFHVKTMLACSMLGKLKVDFYILLCSTHKLPPVHMTELSCFK